MFRGDVSGLSLGFFFTYCVILGDFAWILFYIYRLNRPETTENCQGVIWFYASFGRFLSCCCIILLALSFPKKTSHAQNYISMQRTLTVAKIVIFGCTMYIINNTALIVEIVLNHPNFVCISSLSAVVCHITFVLCWVSIFLTCIYVLLILKDRVVVPAGALPTNNNNNPLQENIELTQALL